MTDPSASEGPSSQDNVEDLHLDRVVASHPEIGPTPPDGGYGWLILIAASIYNMTVPASIIMYGIIIVKSNKESDREDGESLRIWDQSIGLVPVLFVVMRLLLESWCAAVVSVLHSPRLAALAGLCLTVAGVLLSSFATNADDNEFIISLFSGLFAGAGAALTGQQSELMIRHYFSSRLPLAQLVYRIAPALGSSLTPLLAGFLCSRFTNDIALTIYGAVLMQNCFFLAAYTRPIYVTRPVRQSYRALRDAEEDEDEDIFTKRQATTVETVESQVEPNSASSRPIEQRFSSDFSQYSITPQQELRTIDVNVPQPLYRETTTVADAPTLAFHPATTPGGVRRTASVRKNLWSVASMLKDVDFYLYSVLHVTMTYSTLLLGVMFPALVSERLSNSTIAVSRLTCAVYATAFGFACFLAVLSLRLSRPLHKMAGASAAVCILGAAASYGISRSGARGWLSLWGALAACAGAGASTLRRPPRDSLAEFDATATAFSADFLAAVFLMICANINFTYETSFLISSGLHSVAALAFILAMLRPKRR